MIDALDVAREAAWEVAAVGRAVKRYHEAAAHADPADLPPGRRALAETVSPVSSKLNARLDEATAHKDGRPEGWHAPLLLFSPDVLAVIAVATALRATPLAGVRLGKTVPVFSRQVCNVLRDQADHDRWVGAQRKAADKDPEAKAALGRWKRLHPDGSRRAWTRFASRLEGARTSRWPDDVCAAVGGVLIQALVEGAPDWFAREQVGSDPAHMRPICITLTDRAVERMADIETRAEVARPLLLPMLIPPNPWRYAEPTDTSSSGRLQRAA